MKSIIVIICTFLMLGLTSIGCNRRSTQLELKSPDGTMLLQTRVNKDNTNRARYLCVVVELKDAAGQSVYSEVTPASDRQSWSIQWLTNDEILLDSTDIGPYFIRRQPDGNWAG